MADEWTSVNDIGNIYSSKELTLSDYVLVEEKYVDAVKTIMTEAKIDKLKIQEFEKYEYSGIVDGNSDSFKNMYDSLAEGIMIGKQNLPFVVKLILREIVWAKLVNPSLEIHFGYDYYMYVCSEYSLSLAVERIIENGLFVESVRSPYL
ncbi:hypothetical protein KQI58_00570 [Enterococcus raffinosus]|uniref:hypothetical protein n=1 Tax=Enterococcus raffinosus TaxID=71452 RepID=UPI001C0F6D6E|nr:hypothetical protein [Enterococcus raffinosus]MBU5359564.1 hypothetical protein [Enterococcus raffinosus]